MVIRLFQIDTFLHIDKTLNFAFKSHTFSVLQLRLRLSFRTGTSAGNGNAASFTIVVKTGGHCSRFFIHDYAGEIPGIMDAKTILVILSVICATAFAAEDYCYRDVVEACKTTNKKLSTNGLNCTAKYGGIDSAQVFLQRFTNHHFIRSFEYLLMSTHFANYERNRPGFEKLFRELSDNKWHEAIELIQYITKRGGEMNFNEVHPDVVAEEQTGKSFQLYELTSIAAALDTEKKLAVEAHAIHSEASRRNQNWHDPEISSHIENEFVHKQRDIVRKLAGYSADLSQLLNGPDSSLSLFLFDEFLLKQ